MNNTLCLHGDAQRLAGTLLELFLLDEMEQNQAVVL